MVLASPKSQIFMLYLLSKSILSGFKSRWTIFYACKYSNARINWAIKNLHVSFGSVFLNYLMIDLSVPFGAYSVRKYKLSSSWKVHWSLIIKELLDTYSKISLSLKTDCILLRSPITSFLSSFKANILS